MSEPYALTTMTGILIVEISLLSSRNTSRPDLVGNARSNRTASGACSCARLRPSSPFFASTTANPSPASSAVVIVRVHGSSSITSTVSGGRSGKRWRSSVRDVARGIVARLWAAQVREFGEESLVVGGVADVVLVVAVADAVVRLL